MRFVFFSPFPWDEADAAHCPQQLARQLAARGNPVLFVEARASRDPHTGSLPIRILSLPQLGLSAMRVELAWWGLDAGPLDGVVETLRRCLDEGPEDRASPEDWVGLQEHAGAENPGCAVWFAPFDPYVRLFPLFAKRGWRTLYHAQDDFGGMAHVGYAEFSVAAEEYLVREAGAVLAVSDPVAARLGESGRQVRVIPSGLDLEAFRRPAPPAPPLASPPDLRRGERTLGFWGTVVDTMVDADLLAFVAQARPGWAINLIGPEDMDPARPSVARRLEPYSNIHLLGRIPHGRLREYAPFFDACLIPSPDNDFARGRSPIKVYEYLAAGKPVVCAHMPSLAALPFVANADTAPGFLSEIERAFTLSIDRAQLDLFLEAQSWSRRADEVCEVILSLPQPVPAPGGGRVHDSLIASDPIPSLSRAHWLQLMTHLSELERGSGELERWSGELDQTARAYRAELDRIYQFPPFRIVRAARRWLMRRIAGRRT